MRIRNSSVIVRTNLFINTADSVRWWDGVQRFPESNFDQNHLNGFRNSMLDLCPGCNTILQMGLQFSIKKKLRRPKFRTYGLW